MEHVDIYRDDAGEWRWRRVAANGNTIADSGEGYVRRVDAQDMAIKINPGLPIDEDEQRLIDKEDE